LLDFASIVLCANATVGAFDRAQLVCKATGIPDGYSITANWLHGSTAIGKDILIIKNDSNHMVTVTGHLTTMTVFEVGKLSDR
jgi:hypothetical protein